MPMLTSSAIGPSLLEHGQILIIKAALMIAQRFGRGATPMDINGA